MSRDKTADYLESLEILRGIRRFRAPTFAQHRACLFLSRHGKRFLVDFGFDNARSIAADLRLRMKERGK